MSKTEKQIFEKFDIAKHTDVEFNTHETLQLLNLQKVKMWSWGARNFTNLQNKALLFRVSGHHFKGIVAITLNGRDLYDFHLLNIRRDVVHTETDIFFEDLVNRIDEKIERIPSYKD